MKKNYTLIFALILAMGHFSFGQNFVLNDDANNPINLADLRGLYRGCAWVDVDGDGDLDLSTEGWAFRNEGQGSFSIIESFGGGPTGGPPEILGGVSWADYGNDGDLDCLYSATTSTNGTFSGRTIIYENDGTGHFTEKMIDPEGNPLATWSAAWGEYDNDGHVDVTCAVAIAFAGLSTPGFFFRGNADGSFTEIDTFEFTQNTAPYTVAYWSDYDRDGDSDLFLASGPGGAPGPDFHYKNMLTETGTAGLVRITGEAFATDAQDGQCYNFIDYDLDGDLDIYLTNYGGAPNRFYEYENGAFGSVVNALVFGGPTLGNCWGDFDNDGDLDVLVTSDALGAAGYFENQNGVFVKTGNPFAGHFPAASSNVSGLTIGDYDNDGDLDFFAQGGITGANGPRGLYRNDLDNGNQWVNFTCQGNPSNRAAIGTVVYLKATINGSPVWLQREISAQNTFMGHNSLRVHFGLGDAASIDSLVFEWPSGNTDVHTEVIPGKFYTVPEGGPLDEVTSASEQPVEITRLDIQPNPSGSPAVRVKNVFFGQLPAVGLQILSVSGKVMKSLTFEDAPDWLDLETGGLPDGVYFVRLTGGSQMAVGKLVKE